MENAHHTGPATDFSVVRFYLIYLTNSVNNLEAGFAALGLYSKHQ